MIVALRDALGALRAIRANMHEPEGPAQIAAVAELDRVIGGCATALDKQDRLAEFVDSVVVLARYVDNGTIDDEEFTSEVVNKLDDLMPGEGKARP